MEGVTEHNASLVVYLHPSKAKCVNEAILSELSSMLFTYSETFEGVVLGYDPNISSHLAKILPGIHPYFGVKLRAKMLVFNPMPNMVLEGEVVKITPQSIHAVVLRFSSAFIADEDIRDDFKHKIKRGNEVYVSRSNKKHKIKVGTTLRFTVKSFDEDILHISGSLAANNTGCAQWLDKNLDAWSQFDRTTKNRKNGEGEDKKPENDRLLMKREISSLENDEPVKNAKKNRKERG
ncbi:DNA-dependent RNA polymerase I [Handroanthus impetiginosus]|uniref:DNA-directed RNA polymerase subunit n=1 Tax=Handroanthus impetiginosus TaxID=429701 RepID=A0A2G9FZF9_9LAMI|nr:DNA-dependent RNA polymerase I [Handroanthus impetiginosus]